MRNQGTKEWSEEADLPGQPRLTLDSLLKFYVASIDDFSDSELLDYVKLIWFDQTKEVY